MTTVRATQHEDSFRGRTGGKIERAKRVGKASGKASARGGAQRSRGAAKTPPSMGASRQRVVVKTHYVKMGGSQGRARARAHIGYLMRDGVSEQGERGELYGPSGEEDAKSFLDRSDEDAHQFRVILSPEMGSELDLSEYTRHWMLQLESDLGTKLDWVAVNHYNTDNPHVHVLIRGVDEQGDDLRIDRHYMSHGMRHRAEELATAELGPRTQDQVREARLHEVDQLRYTSLDRTLERRADEDNVVNLRYSPGQREDDPSLRCDLLCRARYLCTIGEADEVKPGIFVLEDKLKEHLVELGKQDDIIAHLHRAGASNHEDWCFDKPKPGEVIEAKVLDRGLSDELKGKEYLVVEDAQQRVHHIELGRHWEPDRVKVGEWVRIEVSEPKSGREPEQDSASHKPASLHLNLERVGRLDELVHEKKMTWLDERVSEQASAKHPELEQAQNARKEVLERWGVAQKDEAPDGKALAKTLDRMEMEQVKAELLERGHHKPFLEATTLPRVEGVLREEVKLNQGSFVVLESDRHQILYRATKELREQVGQRVEMTRGEKGYEAKAVDERSRGREL